MTDMQNLVCLRQEKRENSILQSNPLSGCNFHKTVLRQVNISFINGRS